MADIDRWACSLQAKGRTVEEEEEEEVEDGNQDEDWSGDALPKIEVTATEADWKRRMG